MTVTETRSEPEVRAGASEPSPQPDPAAETWAPPTGLAGILSTGDHRVIGRLYIVFSLLFCGFALALGGLLGVERGNVDGINVFVDSNGLFQMFGLYRTTLILCGVVPLLLGLATALIPQQIGAGSVAFPRAAAAAMWTWFVGSVMHIVATFSNGGFGGLTPTDGNSDAIALTVLSLGVVSLGLLLQTGVLLTTLVTQRPAGMSLLQMPPFSWSMLVACGVWLFSLPILLANIMLIWVDLRGLGALSFGVGDSPYAQISWAFDAPQVFAWVIPMLGIVAEVFAAAHRSRPQLLEPLAVVVGAFGFLGFGAWAQPFFNDADQSLRDAHDVTSEVLFVAFALAVFVALLAYTGWLALTAAAAGQRPQITPQLGLVVGAVMLLAAGAVSGVIRVAEPALGVLREFDPDAWRGFFDDIDELGTSSLVTGLMNYVLLAGLLAAVAGLHHWGPRLFGRRLRTPLGFLSMLALAGGSVLLSLSGVVAGFFNQPDQAYSSASYSNTHELGFVEALNVVGAAGAFIVLGGLVLVLLNLLGAPAAEPQADEPAMLAAGDQD